MDFEQQEVTNNGGLVIKLKMGKAEAAFDEQQGNQEPESPAPPQFTRICHLCNKGFHSGKALGGHMRMHAQESKGLFKRSSSKSPVMAVKKTTPTELSPSTPTTTNSSNNGEPVCIECGKIFPSKKSLYGHMRSHPDRPYRGIEPPPQSTKNSSSSTLSDPLPDHNNNHKEAASADHEQQIDSAARITCGTNPKNPVPDLSKIVPSWSQVAKRGRRSASNSENSDGSEDDNDEDMDLNDAVHDLLMLAQGNPKGAEEATNSNFMTKNQADDYDDVKQGKRVFDYKKQMLKIDDSENLGSGFSPEHSRNYLRFGSDDNKEDLLSDSENSETTVIANMMKRKKRRKMRLEDLEGAVVAQDHHHHQPHKVYSCSICNKTFQSHQALGGHVSSHNKIKNNNNNSIHLSVMDRDHESESEDNGNGHANLTNTATAETHQCKLCNKIFPTGQALGGHMRSHYALADHQAQPNQVGHGRKGLDFDLNELPPMEEYEQGGYATSSYNCCIT